MDSIDDIYTVDAETDAETAADKAAPAGVFVQVLSTGARTLYEATTGGLYHYIPKQGVAHRKDHDLSVAWACA